MNALRFPAALVAIALLYSLGVPLARAQAVVNTEVTTGPLPVEFVDRSVYTKDGFIEVAHFEGETQIVSHTTANGNRRIAHILTNIHALGVGTVTGDQYELMYSTSDGFSFDTPPFEATFVYDRRIIGPGPGNNSWVHWTLHVTINANGELTASVDDERYGLGPG